MHYLQSKRREALSKLYMNPVSYVWHDFKFYIKFTLRQEEVFMTYFDLTMLLNNSKQKCYTNYMSCKTTRYSMHVYSTFVAKQKECQNLIHEADPQSRSVVIIVFAHVVRSSVRPHFSNQNKFQAKTMFATGGTVGLADWIIVGTYVLFYFRMIGSW